MIRVGLVLVGAAVLMTTSLGSQQSALDRPINAPTPIELTNSVKRVVKSRVAIVARVARIRTGFEEVIDLGQEVPAAQKAIDLRGMTVRQALDTLVVFDGRYEWRDLAGVVVVRPKAAWADCTHFLHRDVFFDRRDFSIDAAVGALLHLIDPTVRERPLPNPGFGNAQFSVTKQGRLLDLLNAFATSGQLSWSITYGAIEAETRWIEVSLEGLDGSRTGLGGMLRPTPAVCG